MGTGGSRHSILQHRIADGCKRVSGNPECRKPAVGLHTITKKAGLCKCTRKAKEQRNGHQSGEKKAARQDQQCCPADNIVLRNQKRPGDEIGDENIRACDRYPSRVLWKLHARERATTPAMIRIASPTANAIRRSVGPAGRFARTMPFWSAASVNIASIACCRSPLADPPCGQSRKYAF